MAWDGRDSPAGWWRRVVWCGVVCAALGDGMNGEVDVNMDRTCNDGEGEERNRGRKRKVHPV